MSAYTVEYAPGISFNCHYCGLLFYADRIDMHEKGCLIDRVARLHNAVALMQEYPYEIVNIGAQGGRE